MASIINGLRAFGRQAVPARTNQTQNQPPSRSNTSSPATGYNPQFNPSTSIQSSGSPVLPSSGEAGEQPQHGSKTPLFFKEAYAGFIAKGNFMTLALRPQLIEEGEWIAHQCLLFCQMLWRIPVLTKIIVSEQNRLLAGMVRIVQEVDPNKGRPMCNEQTCPTMSAGSVSYSWVDQSRNPMPLPAATYIKHIQTWVNGKVLDASLFPIETFTSAPAIPSTAQIQADSNYFLGKPSGFPQRFEVEVKNMYKQMFRCYAHLYWSHWLVFWDVNAYRELNTCFVHFMNVGRLYSLLSDKDVEPMQGLIDIWIKQGVLPRVDHTDASPVTASSSSSAPAPAASATTPV